MTDALPEKTQSRNTAAVSFHQRQHSGLDNISLASSHYDELMFDQSTCGWSKCKPKKLQKLNSPKWFLFFLAVFSIAQGEKTAHRKQFSYAELCKICSVPQVSTSQDVDV